MLSLNFYSVKHGSMTNKEEMKNLYKLFSQSYKPKQILKNVMTGYKKSAVYHHYSEYRKGNTPFIFVK